MFNLYNKQFFFPLFFKKCVTLHFETLYPIMKKIALILALTAVLFSANAQQVSSRAKAVRMLAYARPEYMVKDVKVYADTMTVFSLADYPIYPLGKWGTVEDLREIRNKR